MRRAGLTLRRANPSRGLAAWHWQRHRSGSAGRQVPGTAASNLDEIEAWTKRLAEFDDSALDSEILDDIERLKLGKRKGSYNPKVSSMRRRHVCSASLIGALLTPHDKMPELPSALPLPEIALTGRSNTGKSSLLNAMCGIKPGPGTASVAARPGWTKSIQFFEMCEASCGDEVMVLTDLPGYGPLENTPPRERKAWSALTLSYLKRATRLRCVFVLVEAPLGITTDDHSFMDSLDRLKRPFHVIMTKADLVPPLELARANALVRDEVASRHAAYAGGDVPMCSARTGAGVVELWDRLVEGIQLEGAGVDIGQMAQMQEEEEMQRQVQRAPRDTIRQLEVRRGGGAAGVRRPPAAGAVRGEGPRARYKRMRGGSRLSQRVQVGEMGRERVSAALSAGKMGRGLETGWGESAAPAGWSR